MLFAKLIIFNLIAINLMHFNPNGIRWLQIERHLLVETIKGFLPAAIVVRMKIALS